LIDACCQASSAAAAWAVDRRLLPRLVRRRVGRGRLLVDVGLRPSVGGPREAGVDPTLASGLVHRGLAFDVVFVGGLDRDVDGARAAVTQRVLEQLLVFLADVASPAVPLGVGTLDQDRGARLVKSTVRHGMFLLLSRAIELCGWTLRFWRRA
jgi:hypothetical protein